MVTLRSIATALTGAALFAQSSLGHSFKRNPLNYVSLIDDAFINTPSRRVHSHSNFDLTFTIHNGNQKIRLALNPNHDIIHDDFAVTHLRPDGTVREIERVPRTEHKVYKGDAFIERPGHQGWSKAGWARITIHKDGENPAFDGAFRVDGDHHNIQSTRRYMRLRGEQDPIVEAPGNGKDSMIVWRDSDIRDSADALDDRTELKRDISPESLCGADSLGFNSQINLSTQSPNSLQAMDLRSLFGRQASNTPALNLANSIGSLDGCPSTRKVALVGIATDCTYWKNFNSSAEIRKSVIDMVNKASELYESTFKISLGIQNLTVSDKTCPGSPEPATPWNLDCSDSFNITDRLNSFSEWRGQSKDTNAYWTLLTRCSTGSAVGLAWTGQLCREGAESNQAANEKVASANVVVGTDTEWQIFAHESGHTFGAFHDCTNDTCGTEETCCPLAKDKCDAAGKFIMSPKTGKGITQFSPCSIGNICSGLKVNKVRGNCLTDNKNIKTITGSQCGNGIVESGEDCDCGGEQGCQGNKCCDPKTCKFTSGSVCDPSNEDCCSQECKFASSGTVCRPSTGVCDPEEVCTGDRASCPEDQHKGDGDSCGDGLNCASGQCTSRDMQCRAMSSSLRGINTTKACPGSGCMLTCTSDDMDFGQCFTLNQNFIDGTACGGGGKCANGACKGASTIKEIGNWIEEHKNIFIPVVSVIGGLILIAILASVLASIRRRIRRRKLAKKMQNWPSYSGQDGGSPPRQRGSHQQWHSSSRGGHYTGSQGQYDYSYPPPPPPPMEQVNQPWGPRQRSARYA
ncbi:metallo-peptidase family M12 domain-containing protein [Hirsutella rhossiliensis]|uniref:Disintegrin and metalloproteinase domain-containing protein B n=1 Tax=Hirsutella rhossiliensis TaxID=111463 RepID=A0A9P8N5K5_9HYPO|nr:metallo-peptidase family m12 domain-containing protein [Hirsutella rhossiliensis]KAH0967012.1 metallo-peptidase family m12 domain-containing protein [Hirsutella rhossiliensis]